MCEVIHAVNACLMPVDEPAVAAVGILDEGNGSIIYNGLSGLAGDKHSELEV